MTLSIGVPRSRSGGANRSRARREDLDEIARLFSNFESIERTLGAALSVAAETLPLSSAILIEEAPGRSSMVCWRTDDESEEAASWAKTHARSTFAYLAGPRLSDTGVEPSSVLPRRAGEARPLFIVIPLVVERSQVFGALQMESTAALDEADLAFVSAIASQLALALTRQELRQPATGPVPVIVREDAFDFAPAPLRAGSRQRRPPDAIAMLASLAAGVVAVDLDGIVTFLNDAAENLLGWTNLEARGMPVELVVNEHDAEGGACISPCEHLLVHPYDEPVHNDRDLFTHRNGARFPVSYMASALFEGGRHTGALLFFDDISARRRAEAMQLCLSNATSVLAEELHCAAAFRRLAQVAVPLLGDICLCDAVAASDSVSRLGHAHVDPTQEAELEGLLRHATSTFTGPIADVIWRRMSGVFPRIDERWRREMLADPADRRMFTKLGIGSLMIVPVTLGERTIGALSFAFVGSRRRHGPAEVSLANQLACRAAFALENGRLYEQSQRALADRDRVLGIVSHDLRNPLSLIMMGTQRLEAGRREGAERRREFSQLLPVIQRASARMLRLVEDLLDYASIDAGKLGLSLAHEDPASILEEAVASFAPLAEARSLMLTASAGAGLPPVRCDRERIIQVLANLVGNALSVTPTPGAIVVTASLQGQAVVFEVSDTGPGLSSAQLQHVFERFWRSEDVHYSGTGMGLAIAEGIVRAHGGRIWAESNLGQGATFAFSLPIA